MQRQPFEDEDALQQLIALHKMADEGVIVAPEDGFLPPLTASELEAALQELSET